MAVVADELEALGELDMTVREYVLSIIDSCSGSLRSGGAAVQAEESNETAETVGQS